MKWELLLEVCTQGLMEMFTRGKVMKIVNIVLMEAMAMAIRAVSNRRLVHSKYGVNNAS